jgi:hypothetical protein
MNFRSVLAGADQAPAGDEIMLQAVSQAARASTEKASSAPYPWILHPVMDLFFCCGGFLWIIVGVYLFSGVKMAATTALMLGIFSNVFGTDMHISATWMRVYGSSRTRKQVGVRVTIAGVLLLVLSAALLFSTPLTRLVLNLTLVLSWQHILAQVYGIVLIYCYKRQYIMSNREKQSLQFLIHATTLFLMIRLFSAGSPLSYSGFDATFLGQLPSGFLLVATTVLQIATALFVFMVVRKWKKEGKVFPPPALLCLFTGMVIPLTNFVPIFLIFFQNFFHGWQYNCVATAYYLKEKGLPEGVPLSKIGTQLLSQTTLRYFAFVVLLGVFGWVCIPVTFQLCGFVTAPVVAYIAISLHHFFADACIWKMRDPVVRKLLIS